MHYVIFDLELNQDIPAVSEETNRSKQRYPFEIIQIGAVKLDHDLNEISSFNRYVRPTIYSKVSPFISELTGITTGQLLMEEAFAQVYQAFINFIGESDTTFCIWGVSDMKELFRNVRYHELDDRLLPRKYINIQPYTSVHLGLASKRMLRLQNAVEALNIPITDRFHDALYDSYYTAEIFIKVFKPSIQPKRYDPDYVSYKHRQRRKVIEFDKLIAQFEKMYGRAMTDEEIDIIKLAYQMGKTCQFITFSQH